MKDPKTKDPRQDREFKSRYDDIVMDLAAMVDADFALLWIEGGKRGDGMVVQHSFTPEQYPKQMRTLAKIFQYMVEWAKKEAGDSPLH